MKAHHALALGLLLWAGNAATQDSIDPQKKAAIRELMTITGAQASQEELTRTFTQQLVSVIRANGVELDDRGTAIIRSETT